MMIKQSFLAKLRQEWATFLGLLLEPFTFVFAIGIGFLYWYSTTDEGKQAPLIIFVLLTFASGVIGGRLVKLWVDMSEGDAVIARGKTAVRALMTQIRSIAALDKRASDFLSSESEHDEPSEITQRNYEEIIRACESLQEQTVSAIENWTDIIPEASIKSQIGVISDLKNALSEIENDRDALVEELEDTKGQSETDKEQLQRNLVEKQQQISGLQNELFKRKYEVGGLLTTMNTPEYYNPNSVFSTSEDILELVGKQPSVFLADTDSVDGLLVTSLDKDGKGKKNK